MYLEFDNVSYVMYIFTCHGHAQPDRIPMVCFEIVGLFDHQSQLVVTPQKTLANSLDTDLARNFGRFQLLEI